jgi:hypothetical protein
MCEIARIVQTWFAIRRFVRNLGGPDDAVMARNHGWNWDVPNGGYSVASSVQGSA